MYIFIISHKNDDYEELYSELEEIHRYRNEYLDDFIRWVIQT